MVTINNKGSAKTIWLIAGAIILVGVAGVVGYWWPKPSTPNQPGAPTGYPVAPPPPVNYYSPPTTSGDAPTSTFGTVPDGVIANITWHPQKKIAKLGLFADPADLGAYQNVYHSEQYADYFEVGTISYQGKTGRVILAVAEALEMGGPSSYRFVKYGGTTYALGKYSELETSPTGGPPADGVLRDKVTIDDKTTIAGLEYPAEISGPLGGRQLLKARGPVTNFMFTAAPQAEQLVFTSEVAGPVYTATTTNGFYVHLADGTEVVYTLEPGFYAKDSQVPQIVWNSGAKNTAEYAYTTTGGCGSSNWLAVVDTAVINPLTDLIVAGKNSLGDDMYTLTDSNSPILKKLYKDFPTDPPLPYAQFVAARPLLFWIDPFDRLVQLQNRKFAPMAECGKPVIYLYPRETTNVSVQIKPDSLSFTEPFYHDGWQVEAHPNGQLINLSDRKAYPYLYWEGQGKIYSQPQAGWVVKSANLKSFLSGKLKALGLKQNEIADFLDFWLQRMELENKPYYFITFMGNQTMDAIAPLTVVPHPDTVIRILMDYTPLDTPIIPKTFPPIHTPRRTGFTVVEWGGVLRKK